MNAGIEIAGMRIRVVRKNIRNLHLSVNPPTGTVRITAPEWMEAEAIRLFAIDKLGWIRRQQKKMREQERETPREYLERESHYVWGRRYLLHLVEHDAAPKVELGPRQLLMRVRSGTDTARREAILHDWYRAQIRDALPALLAKWEPRVERRVNRVFVQHMKTKWGSCNPVGGNIRLNSELARKPPECLEYILLHELAHLREPTHGERFVALMNRLMPNWRDRRDALNRLPVRNEHWVY